MKIRPEAGLLSSDGPANKTQGREIQKTAGALRKGWLIVHPDQEASGYLGYLRT